MAAGDVFGCERAACLRRGEARILGGQTAPSVVGAKKSPQSCGLRIQRSQLPLRDSGNTTVPRAKQNPGKTFGLPTDDVECGSATTCGYKKQPAQAAGRKSVEESPVLRARPVYEIDCGDSIGVCPDRLCPCWSSAAFCARSPWRRRDRIIQHAADRSHAADHRAPLLPLIDAHALGLAERHRFHRMAAGGHRSESHGRPLGSVEARTATVRRGEP